jgi:glycosyltransferase involved in cell wall biosynthesis
MAQEMGARVRVHGAVNQLRLAEIMARSHVFILSSLFEGLPLVVLEALASGCRVVATDLPGVRAVLAGVQADYIERVKMPRLVGLDQPVAADEQRFELDMAHAVQRQLQRAIDQPDIDLTALAEMMAAATWSGIFERVQRIYKLVLK